MCDFFSLFLVCVQPLVWLLQSHTVLFRADFLTLDYSHLPIRDPDMMNLTLFLWRHQQAKVLTHSGKWLNIDNIHSFSYFRHLTFPLVPPSILYFEVYKMF